MQSKSASDQNDTSMPQPVIGFGTGTALSGTDCADLILSALNAGCRFIDSAQEYDNASSIGAALERWEGSRKDVYITSKCGAEGFAEEDWEPRKVLKEQLKLMGTDYVDAYLIHGPTFAKPDLATCWKTMEALKDEGLTKSIGVSNFREEDIIALKKVWTIPPSVNQLEYHPYNYHMPNMLRLRDLLDANDIKIVANSTLCAVRSKDGPLDPILAEIAQKHGVSETQVLIAWAKQHSGGSVVTTTRNESRQVELLSALDKMTLTDEDLARIAEAGKGSYYRYAMTFVWDQALP